MAETLRFTVEVAADQATQALKAVSVAASQAGVEMRTKLLGVGPAARQAGAEIQGLTGKIQAFAREQRAEARTAGFFVGELAQIVPVSNEAKGALTQLGGAMVGGGPVAIGLAAATVGLGLIVKGFVDQSEAADRALDATKKWGAGLKAELDKNLEAVRLLNAEMRGGALGKAEAQADITRAAAAQKVAEAAKERAAAEAEVARLTAEMERTGVWAGLGAAQERLAEATKNEAAAAQNYAAVVERTEVEVTKARAAAGEAQTKKVQEELDKQTKAAEAAAARRLALAREAAEGGRAYGQSEDANLLYRGTNPEIERMRAEALRNAHAPDTGGLGGGSVGSFAELDAVDPAAATKAAADAQASYNAEVQRSAAVAQQWGSALGDVFGALVTGQATAEQVFARVGQMIIQQVVQTAIASITADAARAGAGAAASQAGIPVVGPVLAISAMGAMMSAVLALLSGLPSARNGWWDTGSYEGLMWIHRNERVLNAREAQSSRGGGGLGGATNINIAALDARSVRRVVREQSRDIVREIDRARRRGRG